MPYRMETTQCAAIVEGEATTETIAPRTTTPRESNKPRRRLTIEDDETRDFHEVIKEDVIKGVEDGQESMVLAMEIPTVLQAARKDERPKGTSCKI